MLYEHKIKARQVETLPFYDTLYIYELIVCIKLVLYSYKKYNNRVQLNRSGIAKEYIPLGIYCQL